MTKRFLCLIVLGSLAVGCRSGEPAPGGLAPPPAPGVQVTSGDLAIDAVSERTICMFMDLPSDQPIDVVRFEQENHGYVHHFILFTFPQAHAPGIDTCPDLLFGGGVPIYPGTRDIGPFVMPAGIALPLAAHQQLVLQLHLLNASVSPVTENIAINLWAGDPSTSYQHAGVVGGTIRDFTIPANSTYTATQTCGVGTDMNIFALTSHTHARNTLFSISTVDNGVATEVYQSTTWREPNVENYTPPIWRSAFAQMQFACTWQNDDSFPVYNGPSASDEMCIMYGYYYPSDGGFTLCFPAP